MQPEPLPSADAETHPPTSLRWLGWLVVAVCAGVFALYLQPQFLFTLANQVWACF